MTGETQQKNCHNSQGEQTSFPIKYIYFSDVNKTHQQRQNQNFEVMHQKGVKGQKLFSFCKLKSIISVKHNGKEEKDVVGETLF